MEKCRSHYGVNFLVLRVFLVSAFVHYVHARVDVFLPTTDREYTFYSPTDTEILSCSFRTNNGTDYTFTTSAPEVDGMVIAVYPNSCSIRLLSVTLEKTGKYILTANNINASKSVEEYILSIPGRIFPTEVQVMGNETVFLRMQDHFPDISECGVFLPDSTLEIIHPRSNSSGNYSLSYWGNSDDGECGVEITVKTLDYTRSTWRLWGVSDSLSLYATFNIRLIDDSIPNTITETWYIGKSENIEMTRPNSYFCSITNPRNVVVAEIYGSRCTYTQNPVTDADNGNWTFVFWLNGKVTEDVVKRRVVVLQAPEDRDLYLDVSKSERFNNSLDLTCSFSFGEAKYCHFTRPDGNVIVLQEGIGNDHYSYFGNGLSSFADCGLTIRELQDEDKGEWKCVMDVIPSGQSTSYRRIGFLDTVTNSTRGFNKHDIQIVDHTENVVLKNNSVLTLKCGVTAALRYCWFRHPNGLSIPFSATLTDLDYSPQRQYMYESTLREGECILHVLNALDVEDSGNWTCYLGVSRRLEGDYEVPISVHVTDTDIVSLDNHVQVTTEESTSLKCYSVPLGTSLEYCRFVRPDGQGFNIDPGSYLILGRYRSDAEDLKVGVCDLNITAVADEDLGEWTCAGMLQGRRQEGVSTFYVESGGPSLGAIVGIIVGGVIAIALM